MPKAARITSDLPEPTRPARPTTSPRDTESDAPVTVPDGVDSPSMRRTSSPGARRIVGKSSRMTRPVISRTSSSPPTLRASRVAT